MAIELARPDTDGLRDVVTALREWQDDATPLQLHPGDVGWYWRSGAEATAAAIRTWSRDGRILAVGLLDGPDLLRIGFAPEAHRDEELARQLVADATDPGRGVLPEGEACVETPTGALAKDLLSEGGWIIDEPWTPLRHDLTAPVKAPELRIETIEAARAHVATAVLRSAFDSTRFTDDRWHLMASGLPFAEARCLVGYDGDDNAVAAVTVWSAGAGRPGLIEPMGVHNDHRGHGHGRAITVAAAAALRELGSSSALVATPSANVGAVATYRSAGFEPLTERLDHRRAA